LGKNIDYPRASLRSALQLAEAVGSFAGTCSVELAAEKLGKRVSGAFAAVVGAAVKYKLLESKAGKLWITALYRNYKLAYTPEDAAEQLREALLSPPLFRSIYDRFEGQELPVGHFEKLLIKEFKVPDNFASRLETYFIEGAKQSGLLSPENILAQHRGNIEEQGDVTDGDKREQTPQLSGANGTVETLDDHRESTIPISPSTGSEEFSVSVRGPGMNFSLEIREEDDLEMLHVLIRRIEKALKAKQLSR